MKYLKFTLKVALFMVLWAVSVAAILALGAVRTAKNFAYGAMHKINDALFYVLFKMGAVQFATLQSNILTLHDWAKRLDPDGKTPEIVELLAQVNPILTDALFMEGNLPTGHRTTVRTGLPAVAWRLLNGGVVTSKSKTATIDEQCGMLEAWSEVDKDLCELNGNTASFRLSEAQAFIEAMNQEAASTLFYGNSGTNPEEFTGLATRYSSLSAGNGQNIVNANGSGSDNTSIWLCSWGANTLHGVFPKGSKAGLIHEDMGLVTVSGVAAGAEAGIGQGTRMRAYQDHWQWKLGIALRDWRYAVRIANIDTSNLVAETSAANLIKSMIKAIYRLPSTSLGKPVFYMNRTVAEMLDIQRFNAVAAAGLRYEEVDGKQEMSFRGIPIRLNDALVNTEATVS